MWRLDSGHYARQNQARPFAGFGEPVVIPDPGPDGRAGTGDDGAGFAGYNLRLDPGAVVSPPANIVRDVDGSDSRHFTWEIGAQRRTRGRWSLSAAFALHVEPRARECLW